ncbi:MAG: superfamily endonuclease [Verrucomicrobiota bacterium]|jgi:transposase
MAVFSGLGTFTLIVRWPSKSTSCSTNAGWHKSARLDWHHIKPVYLSPYSPDFNPIERL